MACRSWSSGARMVGLLVPLVFGATMAVPQEGTRLPLGIPEALGCSGSGSGSGSGGAVTPPTPGWFYVGADEAVESGDTIAVATDGFFIFAGSYVGLTEEQALAGLEVTVTTEDGKEIPGSVASIPNYSRFTWTAKAALPIGAQLSVRLNGTPRTDSGNPSAQYKLEVVGEPEPLPEPALSFYGWTTAYFGSGEMVDCQGPEVRTECGRPLPSNVYAAYEVTGGFVELRASTTPKSSVAWEVTISESTQAADNTLYYATPALVTGPRQPQASSGRLGFGLVAEQICAVVTIKDLRTGGSASADICHGIEDATRVSSNSRLAECDQPPNDAVAELWAAERASQGGDSDSPNASPGEPVTSGNPPNPPTSSHDGAAASNSDAGGCQIARLSSSGFGGLGALGIAVLGLARISRLRRRAKRSGGGRVTAHQAP